VRGVAKRTQQVHLALVRAREITAIAHTHHLGATGLTLPFFSGNVHEVFRPPRIGHIDNWGAVALWFCGEWVGLRTAAVADIGIQRSPCL
jgi:hypothetical protein